MSNQGNQNDVTVGYNQTTDVYTVARNGALISSRRNWIYRGGTADFDMQDDGGSNSMTATGNMYIATPDGLTVPHHSEGHYRTSATVR